MNKPIRKAFINASAIILLSAVSAHAQDRLVEVNLKGTGILATSIFSTDNAYLDVGYTVEALYYIKQRLAVGAFLSKSINKEGTDIGDSYFLGEQNQLYGLYDFLQYGVSAKITTKRNRFFHAYGTFRTYYMEAVHDYQDEFAFSIGEKGLVAGFGAGIVMKISRSVGFNIVELNYNQFMSGFEFSKTNFGSSFLQARSGIVVNLKERK